MVEHVLLALERVFRIAAEFVEQREQVIGAEGIDCDVQHLGPDALHLAKSGFVDLLRVHFQRRPVADRGVVASVAVRIAGHADFVVALVLVNEEVAVGLQRRHDRGLDDFAVVLDERLVVRPRRRVEEGRLFNRCFDQRGELIDNRGHVARGRCVAFLHAAFEIHQFGIDEAGDVLCTRQRCVPLVIRVDRLLRQR